MSNEGSFRMNREFWKWLQAYAVESIGNGGCISVERRSTNYRKGTALRSEHLLVGFVELGVKQRVAQNVAPVGRDGNGEVSVEGLFVELGANRRHLFIIRC